MSAWPRFWLQLSFAALIGTLPLALVLGVLWERDALALPRALMIWGVATAGLAALLAWPVASLRGLRRYLDRLAEGEDVPAPEPAPGLQTLFAAAHRLRRRLAALSAGLASEGQMAEAMLDALRDPVLTLDDEGRVVRANRAAAALFGASLRGRMLETVLRSPEVVDAVAEVRAGAAGRTTDLRLSHPVERELECRVAPLADADRRLVLLTLRDRTDARRAEQLRVDFIANASHEIRTPLATLAGCIETLQGPAADDAAARRRFLDLMAQQADRMTHLVEDLLSLSRIEMNEHLAPEDTVDLLPVVRRGVEALRLKAQELGVEIAVEAKVEPALVVGAAEELEQVFLNLVDNAIKYGRDGRRVLVTVAPAPRPLPGTGGAALAVAVRDFGPGIAREHLPRLTERFFRVDTARSRELGGTGLGLAIVKHIVNRHRGVLLVESQPGEGATFTVLLPAPPEDTGRSAG